MPIALLAAVEDAPPPPPPPPPPPSGSGVPATLTVYETTDGRVPADMTRTRVVEVGDVMRIVMAFAVDGVAADPTTVTVRLREGDAAPVVVTTPTVQRDGTGLYHLDRYPAVPGIDGSYRVEGEGAAQTAEEREYVVRATVFDDAVAAVSGAVPAHLSVGVSTKSLTFVELPGGGGFDRGDAVWLWCEFTNTAGARVDPSTVVLRVRDRDDTASRIYRSADGTLLGGAGQGQTGRFWTRLTLDRDGMWRCRFEGTGVAAAAREFHVVVRPSRF